MALCFRFTSSTFSEILSMKPRISSTCAPGPRSGGDQGGRSWAPGLDQTEAGGQVQRGWTRLRVGVGGVTWVSPPPRLQGLPVYSRAWGVLAPTCSKNSSMKPSRSTVTVTSSSSSLSLACAGCAHVSGTAAAPWGPAGPGTANCPASYAGGWRARLRGPDCRPLCSVLLAGTRSGCAPAPSHSETWRTPEAPA